MLCGLGLLSALVLSVLDRQGVKQLGADVAMKEESRKLVSIVLFLANVL